MRALGYEIRRLRGLRSTWLILGAVLIGDCVVAAALARQLPSAALPLDAALRAVGPAVPLLPVLFAALGTGALGALSYGHELRHSGLPAAQVSYRSRLRLLTGKAVVIGVLSATTALFTVLLDTLVLRLSLPHRADYELFFGSKAPAEAVRPVAAFVGLTVLCGVAGLLITSVVRSTVGGIAILCVAPVLLEPAKGLALRATGHQWPIARRGLSFPDGLDRWYGDLPSVWEATPPTLLAVALPSLIGLVMAALLAQSRRRTF